MEITEEELQKKIDEAVEKATKGLFTQDQVNKAVSDRLKDEKTKFEKELEKKAKEATMSAEEIAKARVEELEQKLAEKEGILKKKEHHENISKLMSEKKIDNEFFDVFSGISDIETAKITMDKFNEKLKAKVDTEIDTKIKSHVPGTNTQQITNDSAAINNAIRQAAGVKTS